MSCKHTKATIWGTLQFEDQSRWLILICPCKSDAWATRNDVVLRTIDLKYFKASTNFKVVKF